MTDPDRTVRPDCHRQPRAVQRSTIGAATWITPILVLFALMDAASGQIVDPIRGGAGDSAWRVENPVYVDDSPLAWESFRRAADQIEENPGEAVRLLQELLDEAAFKLLPSTVATRDQFRSLRQRVLEVLMQNEALLQRYRTIETAEAERQLRDGALQQLVLTRSMTRPGLEAMLRLVQQHIDRANFHSAQVILNEALSHPDLAGEQQAHAWFMAGIAAHFTDDSAMRRRALEQLDTLGLRARPMYERFQSMLDVEVKPPAASSVSTLDRSHAMDLSQTIAEPIWSVDMEGSFFSRRYADVPPDRPTMARALDQARQDGYFITAAPTVIGDAVYINEGHTVRAFDRFSGSPIWTRPYVDRAALTIADRDDPRVLDLNIVAVADGRAVTLTGHAYATSRSSDGRLICLDAETGRLRWSQRLDRLDLAEDTAGFFPHSAPVIIEGRVFVLARRVTPQALSSCYLLAFDLDSGDPLWGRHIVSSGSVRRGNRAFSTLVEHEGDLFIGSLLGATARIDPATGQTLWLHRFPVPINPPVIEQRRRPWELTSPAVSSDRVFTILPGSQRVLVLDRRTGDLLEHHGASAGEAWNAPAYLLADDDRVYAVGESIAAFLIDDLSAPTWRLPPHEQSDLFNSFEHAFSTPSGAGLELRGRVQLAGGQLLVPIQDGLLIVDAETGLVRQRMKLDGPGNPLAIDAQLIIAGNDRLDAYMSLRQAEAMLRQRLAERSSDPEPALSLLRLAVHARNLALSLEAAEHAWGRIRGSDERVLGTRQQRMLFNMLVSIEPHEFEGDRAAVESLYAMIDEIVIDHEQRLEHLVAYGDWLATEEPSRALETFQQVLDDPELRSLLREQRNVLRTAESWIERRMGRILQQEGVAIYAAIAQRAEEEFKRIEQRAAGNSRRLETRNSRPETSRNSDSGFGISEELIALGERYPFAEAGLRATLLGAQRLAEGGRTHEARAALIRRMLQTRHPQSEIQFSELLAAYVDICAEHGRVVAARAALRAGHEWMGDVEIGAEAAAGPGRRGRLISERLATLGQNLPGRVRARVGEARDQAEIFDGALVTMSLSMPQRADRSQAQREYALLAWAGVLRRVDSPRLEERWQVRLESAAEGQGGWSHPSLLHSDERHILLWREGESSAAQAILLDAADGSVRWQQLIGNAFAREPRLWPEELNLRMVLPRGEQLDSEEVLPLVDDERLVLVRRDGEAACLNWRASGERAWAVDTGLAQVHEAALRDEMVVLIGFLETADGGRFSTMRPAMVTIDSVTGEIIGRRPQTLPLGGRGVLWMRLGAFGELLYATEEGVVSVDVFNQTLHWALTGATARNAKWWWADETTLIMLDEEGALRWVDKATGAISEPFRGPYESSTASGERIQQISFDGDDLLVLYRDRLMRYDRNGNLLGSDVVLDERRYLEMLRATDRVLVLSEMPPRRDMDAADVGARRREYRLYSMTPDGMLMDIPAQLPPFPGVLFQMQLIDGWLLMSTRNGTIALYMPAGAN